MDGRPRSKYTVGIDLEGLGQKDNGTGRRRTIIGGHGETGLKKMEKISYMQVLSRGRPTPAYNFHHTWDGTSGTLEAIV